MVRKLTSEQNPKVGFQPIDSLQSRFDALALQLRGWAGRRSRVLTLGVIGAASQVGTSMVAGNLANSLAESSFVGQVALVAAENEQSAAPGLIELLVQEQQVEDCLAKSWRENLKLLPFGKLAKNDRRAIPWPKLSDCIQRELLSFDFVIFDLLPPSTGNFSHAISSQLDGLLFVCGPDGELPVEVNQLRGFLRDFPVEVLGKVINRSIETGQAR